eukprot:1399608-Prymnesium_polylepis.3
MVTMCGHWRAERYRVVARSTHQQGDRQQWPGQLERCIQRDARHFTQLERLEALLSDVPGRHALREEACA